MARRIRRLLHSLTVRLLLPLVITSTAVLVLHAISSYRTSEAQWTELTRTGAERTSELIKRATHYGMLLNRKEDVHHTIRQLAKGPDVAGIRVYDKQGTVAFSADASEIGSQMDLKSAACRSCHPSGLHPVKASPSEMTRTFKTPDGETILGVITPIHNEPACSSASCHAHPPDRTILGVLDVQMSMRSMATALENTGKQTFLATLALILVVGLVTSWFFFRVVRRPARRLYEGTQRIAAGDLETRIEVHSEDELGQLADAFNAMTEELSRARSRMTAWSEELETEVAVKTEELSRAQRQVLHMEKMASLGKLSATVAHELNNPLAGILNYGKLIERTLAGDGALDAEVREELGRYVRLIQKESNRCGGIVRNMLLFARRSGLEPSPAHVNEIVRRSAMLMQHHVDMNGVELETSYLEGDDVVVCDASQIEQALVALIVNAIETMSPAGGGTLRLAVREENDEIVLDVGDTGAGIPPEVIDHIFEPFFSTKNKESGVGLGLAVVYGIIQRHGYRIEVDSRLGEGTLFRIFLSRKPPASEG